MKETESQDKRFQRFNFVFSLCFCLLNFVLFGVIIVLLSGRTQPSLSLQCNNQKGQRVIVSFEEEPVFEVELVHPDAKKPLRQTDGSAGYDLYCVEDTTIQSQSGGNVPIGIKMAIPPGYYGQLSGRSSLYKNHGVFCGAGVIDSDYRGELNFLLTNFGKTHVLIKKGDRCGQITLNKIAIPEVKTVTKISMTKRGEKGFGSTGK